MPLQVTNQTMLRTQEVAKCAQMCVGHQNPIQAVPHAGIAKCLHFIATDYCRPIRVPDLEKIAGLSRRGLHKAFFKHTGFGPGQVLRQYRIQRARQILEANDLPLSQVAAMCGYRKANSLWVAFRQVVGVSPKLYQRQVWLAAYLRKPPTR